MSDRPDIQKLLAVKPKTEEVARELYSWAEATREQMASGGLMIGIIPVDDIDLIPQAYQLAAENGYREAWSKLVWWYAMPDYGEDDLAAAEQALMDGIAAGVTELTLDLARVRWFFKRETATEQEKEEAFEAIKSYIQANTDDGGGHYIHALLVTHGFGTEASPEEGFVLQQYAADLKNADAMFELFIHYATGLGVVKDDQLAFQACERAADAGHQRALYNMGAFYMNGTYGDPDESQAAQWYEKAAEVGHPEAMINLASMYALGRGVEVNKEYANELLDQADYLGYDVDELRVDWGLT